jgi:hypothetical protein
LGAAAVASAGDAGVQLPYHLAGLVAAVDLDKVQLAFVVCHAVDTLTVREASAVPPVLTVDNVFPPSLLLPVVVQLGYPAGVLSALTPANWQMIGVEGLAAPAAPGLGDDGAQAVVDA